MLRREQRELAIRVARAYRTISHEAALVLSGILPWDLVAGGHALMYRRRVNLCHCGVVLTGQVIEVLRRQIRETVREGCKSNTTSASRSSELSGHAWTHGWTGAEMLCPITRRRCSPGMDASVSTCVTSGGRRPRAATTVVPTGRRRNSLLRSARHGSRSAVFWLTP